MPDLEAIGDAATGGLPARAVEPGAGEAAGGHTHETACLNCGCELVGSHCHCCGQQAHVHRTLSAFWHDLAHSVLHFEGKIWRTLPMLAWRPGDLTRRYVAGERARFVSPVALFLFTVFLMFAVFSFVGVAVDAGSLRNTKAEVSAAIEEEKRDLRELEESRAEAQRTDDVQAFAKTNREIADTQVGIRALETYLAATQGDTNALIGGTTGWKALDDGFKKLNENPGLALYKIQTNGYKFSWALIPISVPFVWLLFLHRRRYRQYGAYDHLVFVTYSITFMSLWAVTLALLSIVPTPEWLRVAMMAVPPLHIYRQLRGAYLLSRFSAIWRTLVLLVLANIAIGLFFALLLMIGALG